MIPVFPELPVVDAKECEPNLDPSEPPMICLTLESASGIGLYMRQMERQKALILSCPLIKVAL